MNLVRDVLGDRHAKLASEAEIARDFPEFELGAIPPVPTLLHIPMVVDPSVFEHVAVTFAAGIQRELVRMAPDPLTTGTTVTIAPITQPVGHEARPRSGF